MNFYAYKFHSSVAFSHELKEIESRGTLVSAQIDLKTHN